MRNEKKKSLFEKAIDALTNRDETEAAEQTQAEALEESARKQTNAGARIAAENAADEKAAAEQGAENAANESSAKNPMTTREAAGEKTAAETTGPAGKGVVTVRSLRIRADHSTTSEVVGGLLKGDEVTILSIWSNGRDTWVKLDRGWAAMIYRGETYIESA